MEEIFCPECSDTRVVIEVITTPECCGDFSRFGECCNNPITVDVQVQAQCNRCNINLI